MRPQGGKEAHCPNKLPGDLLQFLGQTAPVPPPGLRRAASSLPGKVGPGGSLVAGGTERWAGGPRGCRRADFPAFFKSISVFN